MKDKKQSQLSVSNGNRENMHKVQKSTGKNHKNDTPGADDEPVTEASPDTAKPIEIGDDPGGTRKKIPKIKKSNQF